MNINFVKTPFTNKPTMSRHHGPIFSKTPDQTYILEKQKQLELFGDKLYESYVVKPGKYKLILELENGESFSEIISVREDPLKTSN